MGSPIPQPPVPTGWNCNDCFAVWPPGTTPATLHVKATGMVLCPGFGPPDYPLPPNGIWFHLEQFTACHWRSYDGEGWAVDYRASYDGFAWLQIGWVPRDATYFWNDNLLDPCSLLFDNLQTCGPAGIAASGGSAVVWDGHYKDDIPEIITFDYGFNPVTGNLYERTRCGIDHQCIRIANPRDKTNVIFLVDSEDF